MKLKFTYAIFTLIGLGLLFLNNSGGAAAIQGVDRTGSPLSPGPCQVCHVTGAFSPGIEVDMLDGNTPVTTYVPGQTYTLRVTANSSGNPAGFGFQALAIKASDDTQAGTFSNPGDDTQITTLAGRQYPEHSTRSTSNIFEVDWEAPAAGTGDVNVFSSIVVASGSAGSGGDGSVFLDTPVTLTEGVASNLNDNELLEDLNIFPNPVGEVLNLQITSKVAQEYQLLVTNLQGQRVVNQAIEVTAGSQFYYVNLPSLAAGVYTLSITDGLSVSSRLLMKI